MKPYRTLATVRLYEGTIGLLDNQAARRAGCLKKIKNGIYEIQAPVEFKAGEVIAFSRIPKPYRPLLEKVDRETMKELRTGIREA